MGLLAYVKTLLWRMGPHTPAIGAQHKQPETTMQGRQLLDEASSSSGSDQVIFLEGDVGQSRVTAAFPETYILKDVLDCTSQW